MPTLYSKEGMPPLMLRASGQWAITALAKRTANDVELNVKVGPSPPPASTATPPPVPPRPPSVALPPPDPPPALPPPPVAPEAPPIAGAAHPPPPAAPPPVPEAPPPPGLPFGVLEPHDAAIARHAASDRTWAGLILFVFGGCMIVLESALPCAFWLTPTAS